MSFSTYQSQQKDAKKSQFTASFFSKPSSTIRQVLTNQSRIENFINKRGIQTKLRVGAANDNLEKEADKMAEQVISMPQPNIRETKIGTNKAHSVQRLCRECEDELQRKPNLAQQSTTQAETSTTSSNHHNKGQPTQVNQTANDSLPENFHQQLEGIQNAGTPLSQSQRDYFEPRFGHSFEQVRIHTDNNSQQLANQINARAFTLKNHVVFAANEYQPSSQQGKRLLAHELTHVVQQSQSSNKSIQRACGSRSIGQPTGCTNSDVVTIGPKYLFRVNCDDFQPGNEEDLRNDARRIGQNEIVEIHGYASSDGDPDYNLNLSCARALKAKSVILDELSRRGISATIRVFNHGATAGNREQWRSVVVTRTTPTPQPPTPPARSCGPDVTTWLGAQIATAKRDPVILGIKSRLRGAERVARAGGLSAQRITEGAVAKKTIAEWVRQGRPAMTADARSQIAASAPGQRQFGRALMQAHVPIFGARAALVLAAIRGAALTWKGLVGTGKKYDFKNRPETLGNPQTGNCPFNCGNTITLCPAVASNCFIKDVPGNIFYAHIGRFVGWSELTLQLGSQFAQLDSSATWDSPEDTRMISFAFRLSDPLSTAALCRAINSNRSVFNIQNCSNCSDSLAIQPV